MQKWSQTCNQGLRTCFIYSTHFERNVPFIDCRPLFSYTPVSIKDRLPTAQFLRVSPKFINLLAKHWQACKAEREIPDGIPMRYKTSLILRTLRARLRKRNKNNCLDLPQAIGFEKKDSWLRFTQSKVDSLFPINYSKVISKRFSLRFHVLVQSLIGARLCKCFSASPDNFICWSSIMIKFVVLAVFLGSCVVRGQRGSFHGFSSPTCGGTGNYVIKF